MFQSLHRDVVVMTTCCLRGSGHSGNLSVGTGKSLTLPLKKEGLNLSDDELLRILLRGSPLERDIFKALFQVRAAQANDKITQLAIN
jgi:hypothetical protein